MPDASLNDWSFVLGAADDPKIAWFLVAAVAALGASIGSFLNVVVYRLPQGMSLSHPGSRCPHCRHAIRWFDNVPVLGWLWLGGRCRDCRSPIAVRYPLVEALVGSLAAGLFWLEVVEHGANLPGPETSGGEMSLALPWLRYACHLVLALTLVAAGFMAFDRQPLPLRLWWPALVVGFFAPLVWPELRPVSLFLSGAQIPRLLLSLAEEVFAIFVGAMLGALAIHPWPTYNTSQASPTRSLDNRDQASVTAAVTLFLGWRAAWGTLLIAMLLDWFLNLALPSAKRGRITLPVWSCLVTLALLLAWQSTAPCFEPLFGGVRGCVGYFVAFTVLANLAARRRSPPCAIN